MKCRECGKENVENSKFCFYCGAELKRSERRKPKEEKTEDVITDNSNNSQNGSGNRRPNKLTIAIIAAAAVLVVVGIVFVVMLLLRFPFGTDDTPAPEETTVVTTKAAEETTAPLTTAPVVAEPELRIPNVVGMKSGDAIKKINDLGLKHSAEFAYSDKTPEDYIISQSPAEDTKADAGDTVKIVISRGAGEVVTPHTSSVPQVEQSSALSSVAQGNDTTDYYGLRVSSRYISRSDISWMSLDQIQFAINELYAKLGYRFTKGNEKTYFESMDWYHPDTHDMNVIVSRMNKYEYENIKVMGAYRDSLKK